MIVFVGDKPSSKNTYPTIAFLGTKSYDKLRSWINLLNVDVNESIILNSHTDDLMSIVLEMSWCNFKIIALGNEASKRLTNYHIKHFKLPHPSPRNRKLNDKSYIKSELKKCKKYINGQSK